MDPAGPWMLVARLGATTAAIPIDHVVETMRPLPIEPIAGAPRFVRGMAIVRGTPVPVVDAASFVTGGDVALGPAARFVALRLGDAAAVLLVDEVVAVRRIPLAELSELPPLAGAVAAEHVRAVGMLDARLLLVLDASRVLREARAA